MTIDQLKRHIDRRFANTKNEFQRFATKEDLSALEGRMNARFGDMTRRFESLNAKMDGMFKSLKGAIDGRDSILNEHEQRLRDLESQFRS